MNNLLKKINTINTIYSLNKIDIKLTFINLDTLVDILLEMDQNKLIIYDIKEFNDRQKIILSIFINKYVHLYPTVSTFNVYNKILHKNIRVLNYKNIFRSFFNAINLIKLCKIDLLDKNILQIGILPTFIEAIGNLIQISDVKLDYIKIKSTKNKSNREIYDNLIDQLKSTIEFNLIDNLTHFYQIDLNDLLKDKLLSKRYDLIIFDTYKNLSTIPIDNIQSNINLRLLSAILDSKYILFQLIFSLNKLNSNGDLILLFPGSNHIIYQQILTILATVFEQIELINLDIDYSYRYFVCCKNYKPKTDLINQLNQLNQLNDSSILINILDENNKILDINFENMLQDKFNTIRSDITYLKSIDNQELINKIYLNNYNYQLINTYNLIKSLFDETDINKTLISLVTKAKQYIISKQKNIKDIAEYNVLKTDKKIKHIDYLGEIINQDIFNQLIYYINYLRLFDIIANNTDIDNKLNIKIDLNYLIDKYNLNDLYYIETVDQLIIDGLKNELIIKFKLNSMSPFLLSIFYIYNIIYEESFIVGNYLEYYIIYKNIISSKVHLLDHIAKLYNNQNKSKSFNKNIQLVIIDESYLGNINDIFNRLFNKELINSIRIKSLNLIS